MRRLLVISLLFSLILLPMISSIALSQGNVTLSVSSSVIRRTTRYILDVKLNTTIPSGGKFVIEFPTQYVNLQNGSISCSISKCVACSCMVNNRVITITGWQASTDVLLGIEFPSFENPSYSGQVTHRISTYDSNNTIIDWYYNLLWTFTAETLSTAQLVPGSDVTGQLSKWTIKLVAKYGVPKGGTIVVNFPRWNEDPTKTTYYGAYCSVQTTVACIGVDGFSTASPTLTCSCSSNSDNTSQLLVSINEDLAKETIITFTAGNIRNPLTTMVLTAFSISTKESLGTIEVSNDLSLRVQVSTPSDLAIKVYSIDQTGVNIQTSYTFRFVCPLPIPDNSSLSLSFPSNEVIISSSFTTVFTGSLGIDKTIPSAVFGNNGVFLSEVFIYREADNESYLKVSKIQNPSSTKKSNPILGSVLTTVSGSSYAICTSILGAYVTATPGSVNSIQVEVVDSTVNVKTAYTFRFTPSNNISIGGSFTITAPNEITFSNKSKGSCFIVQGLHSDTQCEITDGKTLKITNGIKNSIFLKGTTVTIQQDQITNPNTTRKTSSGFIIQTFNDENSANLIDSGISEGITATPGTLTSVRVYPSDSNKKITGEVTEYTFEIIPGNTIPKGGKVIIELPEEIIIADTSLNCVNKKGFESTMKCTQQFNRVEVTLGFELADFTPQELSFGVQKVRNPENTQESSTFKAYTKLEDALIDQKLQDITVTIDIPHDLKDARITTSTSIVGSSSDFTFYLLPYNSFHTGGTILLEPPSDLVFPSSPICNAGSVFITSITCIIDTGKLLVTLNLNTQSTTDEIYFSIAGMTNPTSTKETSSYRLTTKNGIYLIDARTSGITVKATTPAYMPDVLVLADKLGISELASYIFTITTIHTIPQNGYVNVKLPDQITISNYLQCTLDSNPVSCSNLGNNNVRLNLFPSQFSPAQITFIISGLMNYHKTIQSEAFIITTRTSEDFEIDSNSSKVVTFTCYSPCETCSGSPTNCLSCLKSSEKPYFWDSKCNLLCQSGYSDLDNDRKTCEKCATDCKTCSGTVESNICTSCISNSSKPYLKSSVCISNCGSYFTPNASFECIKCDSSCNTCETLSSKCTSCPNSDKLYKNTCIDACNPDTMTEISGECFDCNRLCNRCSGDPNFCIACKNNLYLHKGLCLDTCPENVTLTTGQECIDCLSPCRSCLGEVSYCTSCAYGYSLYNNSCVSQCPKNYASVNGVCEKCSSECTNCVGTVNYCTECGSSKFRYNGRCVDQCPDSISVQVDKECLSCAEPCATCITSTSRCTSCMSGYSLNGKICTSECPLDTVSLGGLCTACNSECDTCTESPSNCVACAADRVSYNGSCLTKCPDMSTVQDGVTCAKCKEPCVTCKNHVDECLTCIEGKLLYEGQCLEGCPEGLEGYKGECYVPGLEEYECAIDCIYGKRQNNVCDQECNVEACDFDNGACLSNYGLDELASVLEQKDSSYDNTPVIEEEPMGCTIVGLTGLGVAAVSKVVAGSSIALASLALSSVIEAISWIAVISLVADADYTHGRELLESTDEEILAVFVLLLIVLTVHYVLNVVFVFLYYFKVVKQDNMHRNWTRRNKSVSILSLIVMIFVSFKFVRILYSKLFGLKCFDTVFEHKTSLFRPLLILTYISIALTSIPFIALFVYILSMFSTGNIVWLIALDSLIMTCIVTFISIYDIIQISHTLAREANKGKLKMVAINPPSQFIDAMDYENFKIFPPGKDGSNLETSKGMDYYRNHTPDLETTRFANQIGKFGFHEPECERSAPKKRSDDEMESLQFSTKKSDEDKFMQEEDFYKDQDYTSHIMQEDKDTEQHRDIKEQDVSFAGGNQGYFNYGVEKGTEGQGIDSNGITSNLFIIPFGNTVQDEERKEKGNSIEDIKDTDQAGIEKQTLNEQNLAMNHEDLVSPAAEEYTTFSQNQNSENFGPAAAEEYATFSPNLNCEDLVPPTAEEYTSFSQNLNSEDLVPPTAEEYTSFSLNLNSEDLSLKHSNSLPEPIPEKEPSLSLLDLEPILPIPIVVLQEYEEYEEYNYENKQSWDFEDSREYFDEENEPQLLETILEESLLELSEAEIDQYDPECIIVPHIPSNLDILIKKSFSGALIVDDSGRTLSETSPIKSNQYKVIEVDPQDVHFAKLRRSNSDTLIRVKRDFKGAHILDVKLRMGDKWMVGRTVTHEDDFDFGNAVVDSDDPEAVIVTHNLTGYKMKIKKPFFGCPRVDPVSGRILLMERLVRDYDIESIQVETKDVHFANLIENKQRTRVRRNFLGARILDIAYDFETQPRVKSASYHLAKGNHGFELNKIPEKIVSSPERVDAYSPAKKQMSFSPYKFSRSNLVEDSSNSEYTANSFSPQKKRKRTARKKKLSAYGSRSGSLNSSPERSLKKGSLNSSPKRASKKGSVSPSPKRSTKKGSASPSPDRSNRNKVITAESFFINQMPGLKSLEEIYLQRLELPAKSSPSLGKKSSKKLKDLPNQKIVLNPFTNPHALNESSTSYNKDSMANLLNMRGMAADMDLELLRKKARPNKRP